MYANYSMNERPSRGPLYNTWREITFIKILYIYFIVEDADFAPHMNNDSGYSFTFRSCSQLNKNLSSSDWDIR